MIEIIAEIVLIKGLESGGEVGGGVKVDFLILFV